jgi:hypothetical protein
MDSIAFSPSSWSNLTIYGSQSSFGTISFRSHPPTLILVFANLNREIDLTFRSLNFCIGSLGSLRLSDMIYLGPSASKTTATTTLESSVGSSSEVKLLVIIKPVESEGNLANPLDEILYNLNFKDESDLPHQIGGSEENFHCNSYFNSKEEFTS